MEDERVTGDSIEIIFKKNINRHQNECTAFVLQ